MPHLDPIASAPWIARAPGRVNLIGEHIDYNDGWVLPMAIEAEVLIRATPRADRLVSFTSTVREETSEFDLNDLPGASPPPWGRYLHGVLVLFFEATGADLPGFDARIESTVPEGGGLSSSAALEVAAMTLLERISGQVLPPLEKALLCRRVEHEYAGVPCGIMDQMVSVLGKAKHLLLIDCATHEARAIPLDPELAVLVCNTGVSHALADGEYARRREDCAEVLRRLNRPSFRGLSVGDLEAARDVLGDTLYRRGRHVVSEIARTLAAVDALENKNWEALGEGLYASHESLARDYEVSCPELDRLVATARALGQVGGVVGARMTGGGFGGCAVALVWQDRADEVTARLQSDFQAAFGRVPACFVTRPANGAG